MGYSHYLYRPLEIKDFDKASAAIERCAALLADSGIKIVGPLGDPNSQPIFSETEIRFNGSKEQGNGWQCDRDMGLVWPKTESDTTDNWFGGNLSDRRVAPLGNGSYESVVITKKVDINIEPYKEENWNYLEAVKTNFAPYDILAMVAYAAVRYYDRRCIVKSDGKRKEWAIAFEVFSGVVEETPAQLETLIFDTPPEPNSPPPKKVKPAKVTPKFNGATVKKYLKGKFPGVKFTARKTNSWTILVEWQDGFNAGATQKSVDAVLKVFWNGYSDGYDYHISQQIRCHQTISPEWQKKLEKKFEQMWGKSFDPKDYQTQREFNCMIEQVYDVLYQAVASDNYRAIKSALHALSGLIKIDLKQKKPALIEIAKQILAD